MSGTSSPFPDELRGVEILQNSRVQLSPVTGADIERIYDACQDASFARWLPWAADGYTWDQAEQFALELSPQQWLSGSPEWAIRPLNDNGSVGPLAGVVGMRDRGEGAWDIGFWLHRDSQGRGLMSSACALAINATFEILDAKRIMHFAEVGNDASRRVARSLGFTPEGIRRVEDPADPDRIQRQWQSAIVRPDWERMAGDYAEGLFPKYPTGEVLAGFAPQEVVAEFHSVYGMPNRVEEAKEPSLAFERLHMRMSLIEEEVTELVAAVYGAQAAQSVGDTFAALTDGHERDLVETADALADLVYVIYGMALESGIDLDAVLGEVHSSNLSKLMPDGSVKLREDGKILKGPNFRQPDIATVLGLNRA